MKVIKPQYILDLKTELNLNDIDKNFFYVNILNSLIDPKNYEIITKNTIENILNKYESITNNNISYTIEKEDEDCINLSINKNETIFKIKYHLINYLYVCDEKGYFKNEIEQQAGVKYLYFSEDKPDFEKFSSDRYLAKLNFETNAWEYEVKPEILKKEKEEQEKLEAEQRQKEYEEQLKQNEETDNKPSITFVTKDEGLNLMLQNIQ